MKLCYIKAYFRRKVIVKPTNQQFIENEKGTLATGKKDWLQTLLPSNK